VVTSLDINSCERWCQCYCNCYIPLSAKISTSACKPTCTKCISNPVQCITLALLYTTKLISSYSECCISICLYISMSNDLYVIHSDSFHFFLWLDSFANFLALLLNWHFASPDVYSIQHSRKLSRKLKWSHKLLGDSLFCIS